MFTLQTRDLTFRASVSAPINFVVEMDRVISTPSMKAIPREADKLSMKPETVLVMQAVP